MNRAELLGARRDPGESAVVELTDCVDVDTADDACRADDCESDVADNWLPSVRGSERDSG